MQEWLEHEHHVDLELLERVKQLQAAGIKCYVATNQEFHRANYMEHEMGFGAHFDGFFASSRLGVKKPDSSYFVQVQDQLELLPQQILFWDDSPANVQMAQQVGWNAQIYTLLEGFDAYMSQLTLG